MNSGYGILDKSGAWYSYKQDRIGLGRENAKLFLTDHPETAVEIEKEIMEKAGLKKTLRRG